VASIRSARLADEPTLLGMLLLLADFPVPDWRSSRQIAEADRQLLLDALHHPDPRFCVLVAEDPPGSVAGLLLASTRKDYFTGRPHAHIEVLTVKDAARGRGVARELIEAAEGWAGERGYDSVTLNVFARNERASSVYQRLGYAPETVHYIKPLDRRATRGEVKG
jgi:ribosomal protein S18 acetylase RimI-like enzyme